MANRPNAWNRFDELYAMMPMDPDMRAPPERWLAPGLLLDGKVNVWCGAEKAGKSRLLGWALTHMYAEAETLGLGRLVNPGRTLYLCGEETPGIVTDRYRQVAKVGGLPYQDMPWADLVTFCEASGMRLETTVQRQWLRQHLLDGGYQLLVVDPLRRVHNAKESDNDEMSVIYNDLRDWSNKMGLTILMIHHTGKLKPDDDESRIATWLRGATDLAAVLDWCVYVKRHQAKTVKEPDRVLVTTQGRAKPRDPLVLYDGGDDKPWRR